MGINSGALLRPRAAAKLGAVVLAAATVAGISGCSDAPFLAGQSSATPTPTPSATVPAPVQVISNDLATGSAKRDLEAGNIQLSIVYYSTLGMDKWTADANKPVSFSLVAKLAQSHGEKIYLSRVSLTPAVAGPAGTLAAPAALVDTSTVSPGYYVKSPYSYSQTFVIPAVDPAATSVTLSINYEMLLQTSKNSKSYSKQTASDTLTVAIAQPPAED